MLDHQTGNGHCYLGFQHTMTESIVSRDSQFLAIFAAQNLWSRALMIQVKTSGWLDAPEQVLITAVERFGACTGTIKAGRNDCPGIGPARVP